MKRTAEETAILVALLQKRADVKRARISEKTIRVLSKRRTLRTVFLETLGKELDDLGIHMVELERGGFGIIPVSALDGAPAILAKRYLTEDLKKLKRNEEAFARFRAEIEQDTEESDESED